GLRYDRDTGRTDSDLPPDPFINSAFPGMGNSVKQANLNFAPQIGIAWDPMKNGKTVIRAGAGLYYENAIFNNVLFDRPARLQSGLFFATAAPCFNGSPTGAVPGVADSQTGAGVPYCGAAIGNVAAQIAADQTA